MDIYSHTNHKIAGSFILMQNETDWEAFTTFNQAAFAAFK